MDKKQIKQLTQPLNALVEKSLKEIETNSKAIEEALEKFLASEGIQVSEKEYNEIKQLTDTLGELDYALIKLSEAPVRNKPVKKKKKKVTKKSKKTK